MKVLITNDDSIYSPGILTLAEAARALGQVFIFAPNVEQSSMGHAITADRPLTYLRTQIEDFEAYRVDGTPADCVALGAARISGLDVVLSGINQGTNLGNAIWHSGTLAAAKQAALLGLQGIAVSMPVVEAGYDYAALRPYLQQVFDRVVGDRRLPLVNVNMPLEPRGVRWTRQSVSLYDGTVVRGQHPRGREIYWFVVEPIEEVEEDTDRFAFQAGYVSMTPLRLDLTDHAALERVLGYR